MVDMHTLLCVACFVSQYVILPVYHHVTSVSKYDFFKSLNE